MDMFLQKKLWEKQVMLVRSHFSGKGDFWRRKLTCPICLQINHQKEHPFLAKKNPTCTYDRLLFWTKLQKLNEKKTQEIQNSSTILLKNSRYWNLFQIFNRNKLKKPKKNPGVPHFSSFLVTSSTKNPHFPLKSSNFFQKLMEFVQKLKEFVQKLNVLELLGPVGFQFDVQKKAWFRETKSRLKYFNVPFCFLYSNWSFRFHRDILNDQYFYSKYYDGKKRQWRIYKFSKGTNHKLCHKRSGEDIQLKGDKVDNLYETLLLIAIVTNCDVFSNTSQFTVTYWKIRHRY